MAVTAIPEAAERVGKDDCSVVLPTHDWAKGSLVLPSYDDSRISFTRVFNFRNHPKMLLCTIPGTTSSWTRHFGNAVYAAMTNNSSAMQYSINVAMEDIPEASPLLVALESLPAEEVISIACSREWERIAIVRNPFTRILSKFLDKLVLHAGTASPLPYHPEDGQDFGKFVQRLVDTARPQNTRSEAEYVNGHFRSQSNFCGLRYIPYRFVHMEALYTEAPILARQLAVDAHPGVHALLAQLRPYNACSDALRLHSHYDARTAALVRSYFAEDFRRFRYAPHFPSVAHACA